MRLGIGEIGALKTEGEIISSGIGSCVLIILYDEVNKIGGIAHILLPDERYSKTARNENRFPRPALRNLIAAMEELGADRSRIFARLVGGASMFENNRYEPIGSKNVTSCRSALAELYIPIRGEDTGGNWGRSVSFDIKTGRVRITTYRIGMKEL
ncbi:MAG TPA: chemotaxis protein CheD [bacterium (Candidatus Stahlbacteria)]|nr:chemotaxis protein CheD [Candidatus Stahlbacteria bacterium]